MPQRRAARSQRQAAEGVVKALRDLGRVEDTDGALLAAYVRLAAEIDDPETRDRAGLYREFRAYDAAVRSLGGSTDGDSLDDLLASLSAEVGHHPAPRPANEG